jgi:integrase
MSKARLITTEVVLEGRSQSTVAAEYGASKSWSRRSHVSRFAAHGGGLMVEVGAHIETMKQRLGHSSIRVTSDVYGSVIPAVDDALTAALEARFADL